MTPITTAAGIPIAPERVVHAKGSGACGTFTVTHDITRFTKAAPFSAIAKQTETFVRFSTIGGERGSADTERDPRGIDDDDSQVGNLYRLLPDEEQDRAMAGVSIEIRQRQIGHVSKADPRYGAEVARKIAALAGSP